MERFAHFVIRHRWPILGVVIAFTIISLYWIKGLGFKTVLEDTLPSNHPYVQVHEKFQKMFGGANTMTFVLESKKGDIFNRKFLEKLKFATDEIKFYPDANTAQVISISRNKLKNIRGISGGLDIAAFFKNGVPQTKKDIEALRENIFSNESVRGIFVAATGKAALIIANFKDTIDYQKLFSFLQKLKSQVEDEDISVFMSGRPTLMGWIYHNNLRALAIFIVSLIAEVLFIAICFRRFHPLFIPLPIILSMLNTVWGLGVMGIAGFNLDPLGVVIPFVIAARIISHSVQMTERYGEIFSAVGDKKEASIAVMRSMFVPSAASIVTDAAGLFVMCIVPIPLLQTLGWVAGLWLLSAILGVSILNPILFSFLPNPLKHRPKKDMLEKAMEKGGYWLTEGRKRGGSGRSIGFVLATWGVIFIASLVLSRQVDIGDSHPGSALLWPDSTYNQDDAHINKMFPGTNTMLVILDGKAKNVLKDPQVLQAVEAFERELRKCEGFGGTESLVGIVKKLNREFHEGDPKWSVLPYSLQKTGFYLWMFEAKSDPGDLGRWTDLHYQYGNIICYFKDHQGKTVQGAISRAKEFLSHYPIPEDKVEFRLAGGLIGVTAATNETVAEYTEPILWIALGIIFLCCVIPYRSIIRGIILVSSLVTANYVAMAYMAVVKMGMTIDILPVVSIGAGLGVDYGIYMLSRIKEELEKTGDMKQAIQRAFPTTGRAIVVTGFTVIFGIVFWYFSTIRFQAQMGFLLAFLLFMNMLGALFLVPALTYILRPRVVLGSKKSQEEGR